MNKWPVHAEVHSWEVVVDAPRRRERRCEEDWDMDLEARSALPVRSGVHLGAER